MKLHPSKILKIIFLILYIIVVLTNFTEVFATAFNVKELNGNIPASIQVTPIKKTLATVLDVVRMVGVGIALIILIVIGIKIMIAAPDEKANIKQYSINYVIGAFILLGASSILGVIKSFTDTAIKTE